MINILCLVISVTNTYPNEVFNKGKKGLKEAIYKLLLRSFKS